MRYDLTGESWRFALTALFLGLLALAWLGVFFPAVLRARRDTPYSSSERFRLSMDSISPRGGRYVVLPAGDRRPATSYRRALLEGRRMARRRRIFFLLVITAGLSAFVAALGGPGGWELHLVADLVLGVYVAFLIEVSRRRNERATKVRRIHRGRPAASSFRFNEPVAARRRA